jgi:hypothetical protein
MFFKAMPKMSYKADGKTIATKDIFRRVGLDRQINSTLALESYYISDGETPDIVANNIYGSSNYHWVLLTVNDIVNPHDEWPRREAELFDYTESKYGTGNALLDHHYRLDYRYVLTEDGSVVEYDAEKISTGEIKKVSVDSPIIVDYDAAKILSGEVRVVSNYDYELDLNQAKRQIFILKSDFLAQFVKNYQKLMA